MNRVLIVAPELSAHLICELPRLFKKAGYKVTLLAYPNWAINSSSYVDEFIKTSADPKEAILDAAKLVQTRRFDFKILVPDALIWALLDSDIEPAIKEELYPIRNLDYIGALDGKIGAAKMFKDLKIDSPPSKPAHSLTQAIEIAQELGFPVMVKVSRSGGGTGVIKCERGEEIKIETKEPVLVEKFIEGDLVSVEALFLKSRLKGYSYSILTYCSSPFAPSLERIFLPSSQIEPILENLGNTLQMNCFTNITFIREKTSGKHFLIECDFRPNRWVRHSELVGVDWSKAIRDPDAPIQKPHSTKLIRHFPSDFWHAVKTKQRDRIFYWLMNKNSSWKSIPYHDLKPLFGGILHGIKKLFF